MNLHVTGHHLEITPAIRVPRNRDDRFLNGTALRETLEFRGSPNLEGNKLRAIGVIMCVM